MAKLSKPPIPLTLYKHFAVATIILTAAIAMFADDGNRQAMAEHIEERERQEQLREASARITGPPRLVRAETAPQGEFGDENIPLESRRWRASSQQDQNTDMFESSASGRISVPGYDQEWIDALSEEDYAIFREQTLQGNPSLQEGGRAEARRRMMDRQRRQSGHSGSSDYIS